MNHEEAWMLTRIVQAACPQQAMDDYTPDAWHDLLDDLNFADCHAAVRVIGKRQPFIAPAEIRTEVQRIRSERIARSVIPAPSPERADDPAAYRRALTESIKRAADGHGEPVEGRLALTGGAAQLERREALARPATLRASIGRLRATLGPARRRRPSSDPREIARQQADQARAEREAQDGQEGRAAS